MDPHRSRLYRPPFWLPPLFPRLGELEHNAVYQLLSPRRRRWSWRRIFSWPPIPEFAKLGVAARGWWTAPVAAFILAAGAAVAALPWAIPVMVTGIPAGGPSRMAAREFIPLLALICFGYLALISLSALLGAAMRLGRRAPALKRFLMNAERGALGEDLGLCLMPPDEIDRGLAAAMIEWFARNAISIPLVFAGFYMAARHYAASDDHTLIELAREDALILSAAVGYALLLVSMYPFYLGITFRGELASARLGAAAEIRWAMLRIAGILLALVPGAALQAMFLWLYYPPRQGPPPMLYLEHPAVLMAAFFLPSYACAYVMGWFALNPALGCIGQAINLRVRARLGA